MPDERMSTQPVRNAKLERLLLDILTVAVMRGTRWEVSPRDDDENHLDINARDAETGEIHPIARIEIVGWDMTGGLMAVEDLEDE
jgi:hypothetical protein